jgi:hypothetical protein
VTRDDGDCIGISAEKLNGGCNKTMLHTLDIDTSSERNNFTQLTVAWQSQRIPLCVRTGAVFVRNTAGRYVQTALVHWSSCLSFNSTWGFKKAVRNTFCFQEWRRSLPGGKSTWLL